VSQEPDQAAYILGSHNNRSCWGDLEANPTKVKRFTEAKTFIQSVSARKSEFVLEYDWYPHSYGTVIHVGGSQSSIAYGSAQKHLNLEIIVQDRPEIIVLATESLHGNVQFQAHGFFISQPVHGPEVYFFRWILYDWQQNIVSRYSKRSYQF
jgi:hypothetical protein